MSDGTLLISQSWKETIPACAKVAFLFALRLADREGEQAFNLRLRPYHVESIGSRQITEVKQRRAWLVLGWVTAMARL